MSRQSRSSAIDKCAEHVEQLMSADRTSAQFEVDFDVIRNGRGCGERRNVFRAGVDTSQVVFMIGPVLQRLNSASRGTGSNRHNCTRNSPHILNPLCIVRCRDRSFNQRDVVRAGFHATAGLREIRNLHGTCDRQQFILTVQQRQLAPIAGRELKHGKSRTRSYGDRRVFRSRRILSRRGISHRSATFKMEATRS